MIDAATWFAWFVLLVLFSVVVIAIVALGSLPGQIARRRSHPHADAIQVAGWLGLAMGGVGWPIAVIWAYLPFESTRSPADSDEAHTAELEDLRRELAELRAVVAGLSADGRRG